MKVVFLTDSLSDLDGVGRYAVRLISAIERARPEIEVHVLLARKHRPTSADVPPHWRVEVGLPPDYFFYMSPARFSVWRAIGTWNTLRAARSADLVHAIKDFPHSLVAVDAADRAGVPCVATGHGTYTIQPIASERHRARALSAYRRFATLISVSRYTRERLLERLGPDELDPERVVVIPNAVDAEDYASPREVGSQPWHAYRFTLGIGELKERKGHHLAVAAWARVAQDEPGLHHVIVGNRSGDDYERSLLRIAEDAGVADRLHLVGNVSEDEKVDLLRRAEMFLHTPVTAADGGFEGFGIVYLEAAAAGTVAIGTLDSGAEDAIVDGRTGLLVEQNADAVEVALRRLLASEGDRARLAEGARDHATASSWDGNARRVLEIYDRVLAERSESGR
ncbi:MAG: glycosyltransferase family 4 protein [Planctomycetota bacterium]